MKQNIHYLCSLFIATLTSVCPLSAGSWSQPVTIGENKSVAPSVGIDAAGNSVAVWLESDDSVMWIQGATLSPHQNWILTDPVSDSMTIPDFSNFNPSVAVNWKGDAVAVWIGEDLNSDNNLVFAATLPFGSTTWSTPYQLSAAAEFVFTEEILLEQDTQGNLLAAWGSSKDDGSSLSVESATFDQTSGTWSSLPSLIVAENFDFLNLALSQSGKAVLVWGQGQAPAATSIMFSALDKGASSWSAPNAICNDSGVFGSEVVIDAQGNAVSAWVAYDRTNKTSVIHAATLGVDDANWELTEFPSTAVDFSFSFTMAMNLSSSQALVALAPTDPSQGACLMSTLKSGASLWSSPQKILSSTESIQNWALEVDAMGNVMFMWQGYENPERMEGSVLSVTTLGYPVSRGWSNPVVLASSDSIWGWAGPVVSTQGTACVLYVNESFPDYTLQAINGSGLFPATKKLLKKPHPRKHLVNNAN